MLFWTLVELAGVFLGITASAAILCSLAIIIWSRVKRPTKRHLTLVPIFLLASLVGCTDRPAWTINMMRQCDVLYKGAATHADSLVVDYMFPSFKGRVALTQPADYPCRQYKH